MNKRISLRHGYRIRTRIRSAVRYIRPPKPKPLILLYHRIAEPPPADPWGLSVSPAHFLEQLEVLSRTRQPFPLVEFVRSLIAGTLPSNAVALTLDDGYVDNLSLASRCLRPQIHRRRFSLLRGTLAPQSRFGGTS